MVIVAYLAAPKFAATLTVIVWLPVPEVGVTVIQLLKFVTLQEHPAGAVTVTDKLPPDAGTLQ